MYSQKHFLLLHQQHHQQQLQQQQNQQLYATPIATATFNERCTVSNFCNALSLLLGLYVIPKVVTTTASARK